MDPRVSRREFAHTGLAALGLTAFAGTTAVFAQAPKSEEGARDWLPMQDPAMVKEMVTVSHFDLARVRALVEAHPALSNASVDWGFGDWEDALGAASHTGRREIAELLLSHGARGSIFSATMLGQLDVVKAFVAARPGIQSTMGPHGITLLAHAKAGGPTAAPVLEYLTSVGDADRRPTNAPLDAADRDAIVGRYVYGAGERDAFVIDVDKDQLGIVRPGGTRRILTHTGTLVFYPAGAPSVKIAFAKSGGRATQMTIADPDVMLTAKRA